MKLFKKRDTHGGNVLTSPAGSLDRTIAQSQQQQQQQSPTPSAGAGAVQSNIQGGPPGHPSLVHNGSVHSGSLHSGSTHSGRESALQYPWSSRRISNNNPFPRYGHATNAQTGKEGGIYVFGGLIKEKAMSDLWVIAPGDLQAKPVTTTGDMPSARVGHAALLIGNAFIVFGGDTKLNGLDTNPNNDDSLYLLNTSTKIWTVAKVAGAKPSGRYGHTLNMLGPKVLVFGGQVEGFFFNDLVAFDLNTLNNVAPRWELITPVEGSEPPPSRTNHVAIAHNDKLYIFGGTNGQEWYNDMWRFDPVTRAWQLLECSGYVPQPREGHSASLVGDVIYVFGGRDVDGNDLGDLSAFKISSSRWFTFQNMGPGPSARSGHALCTVGKKIFVVGGEGAASHGDEQHAYILDTTKIRYPAETRLVREKVDTNAIKSVDVDDTSVVSHRGPEAAQPTIRSVSGQGTTAPSRLPQSSAPRTAPASRDMPDYQQMGRRASAAAIQQRESQIRPPKSFLAQQRNASSPNPSTEMRKTPTRDMDERPAVKRAGSLDSMMETSESATNEESAATKEHRLNKVRSLEEMRNSGTHNRRNIDNIVAQEEEPGKLAPALRHVDSMNAVPIVPPALTTKSSKRLSRRLSAYDESNNYLTRIAWLEAELNLARRSGYLLSNDAQNLDKVAEDSDSNVMQALVAMRDQLNALKEETKTAKAEAHEKISTAISERDVALRETAHERARNLALINLDSERFRTIELQRSQDLEARLVDASTQTRSLERQVFSLQSELATTKRTREDHDILLKRHNDAATEAEEKYAEILSQHNSMRSVFSETQAKLQEHQSKRMEAESALSARANESEKLRDLEGLHAKHIHAFEMTNKATAAATARASHAEVSLEAERQKSIALQEQVSELSSQLESTRAHLTQQSSMNEQLEEQLQSSREEAEKSRHAMSTGIEGIVNRHRTMGPHDPAHHQTELDNLSRDLASTRDMHQASQSVLETHGRSLHEANERLQAVETAKSQQTKEVLAMQRRLAESQAEMQDLQTKHISLMEEHAARKAELEESQLKYSSLQQIMSIRPSRRDSVEKRRSRNLTSPMPNGRSSQTPDASRLRELEMKLAESAQLHKDMQASHVKATEELEALTARQLEPEASASQQDPQRSSSVISNRDMSSPVQNGRRDSMRNPNKDVQLAQARAAEAEKQLSESTQNFKERLGQLEADYQSAVHYVKGTEKMLRRMKEELGKYKTANAKLQTQLEEKELQSGDSAQVQDTSKSALVELEDKLSSVTSEREALASELSSLRQKLETTRTTHNEKLTAIEAELSTHKENKKSLEERGARVQQLEDDLEEANLATQKLEFENRELERGMQESESKVKMLLDQFEQSVDTYRRQSVMLSQGSVADQQSVGHHSREPSESMANGGHALAPPIINGNPRTSSALDLLANELDQLRTHWASSARNSTYRSPDLGSEMMDRDFLRHES